MLFQALLAKAGLGWRRLSGAPGAGCQVCCGLTVLPERLPPPCPHPRPETAPLGRLLIAQPDVYLAAKGSRLPDKSWDCNATLSA